MVVQIVSDTTAGLLPEFVREHHIAVLPQMVIFDEESYRDDTELDTQTFLQKLKSSPVLPKTAAPPPALYGPVIQQLAAAGDSILVITPTSEASGTYRSALTAAADFPGVDIRVFDSRTAAGPLATLTEQAARWAEEGQDMDAILQKLQAMAARQHALIVVDTLEFLHKGGRIGGAQALVGSLLQLKPILQLKNGQIEPFEIQRTHRKAIHRLEELVLQSYPREREGFLSIMHSGAGPESILEAEWLAADLASKLHLEHTPIYILPPAILVHAGPGVLAAGWFA